MKKLKVFVLAAMVSLSVLGASSAFAKEPDKSDWEQLEYNDKYVSGTYLSISFTHVWSDWLLGNDGYDIYGYFTGSCTIKQKTFRTKMQGTLVEGRHYVAHFKHYEGKGNGGSLNVNRTMDLGQTTVPLGTKEFTAESSELYYAVVSGGGCSGSDGYSMWIEEAE